ncbi:MAG: FAD-binding protein [Bacteroidia bacterium]|nr:FAD-binding protein [Bacteroidia bacterium]
MQYNKVSEAQIKTLQTILGAPFITTGKDDLEKYSRDFTENLSYTPDVVVKPGTPEEVSAICKFCYEHNIPFTPRGAGTGLSGGALPVFGGIVISMERFNKIIEIDEHNFQATVEPGVINEEFQNAVIEKGLFYPPDPASKGSCFLGGNIAHASGGPRALKYGTTRDYVLNLEVVLPTGEIIWTGANTLKYSTGYNLTHLLIGSEGTLGIVTKIVFKLIPYPTQTFLLLASFASPEKACEAVNGIFLAGCSPSACEFVEPEGFRLAAKVMDIAFECKQNVEAYLLIEVDGNDTETLMNACERINEVLDKYQSIEVLLAQSADEKEYFWKLRRMIGAATKHNNEYKEEDTVVPRAALPTLYRGVKTIEKKYGFRTVCYGHAGDGNMHVNILKDNMTDEMWNNQLPNAIREIFTLCKELKGTISGEHGIGLVQKQYMNIVMPEIQLEIMRKIKQVFDPKGLLNPGKIF